MSMYWRICWGEDEPLSISDLACFILILSLGADMVIFDLEIHMAKGVPIKSMSIDKLRTVLIIKNG